MVPTKSQSSDRSASPLPTLPDLPEPPAELTPHVIDMVRRGVDDIGRAANGAQEDTLNATSFRIGRLVGAGAIGIEDACRPLEEAALAMHSYDARRPWTVGYIRYKVRRSVSQGAAEPDPIYAIRRRGAGIQYANTPVVPPSGGDNPPFTDLGNGERFAKRYGHEVRYCNDLSKTELGGWMRWNGTHWQTDDMLGVLEMAKECVRAIAMETPPVVDDPTVDRQGNVKPGKNRTAEWALKCEDEARLLKMTRLARSSPPIPVPASQFDIHPYLFNVLNGTIDLGESELRPADQGDLLTQVAPVVFDPDARCPLWEKFLIDTMGGRPHMVEYLQTWIGYGLTGETSEQKMLLHYGTGANGKSTFLNILNQLMGPYFATAASSSFMANNGDDGARNDLAALRPARFVAAVESNERQTLDEALIKSITGGDPITSRFLHREFFTYTPQFKINLATNVLPQINGLDYGTWRRLNAVEWGVTFGGPDGEHPIDLNLESKLREEMSGILNWALEGCARWLEKGLSIPPEVSAATDAYKEVNDILGPFIEECLILEPTAHVSAKELYDAYLKWDTSTRTLGKRSFNSKISSRAGITSYKSMGLRAWRGIAFSEAGAEMINRGIY